MLLFAVELHVKVKKNNVIVQIKFFRGLYLKPSLGSTAFISLTLYATCIILQYIYEPISVLPIATQPPDVPANTKYDVQLINLFLMMD